MALSTIEFALSSMGETHELRSEQRQIALSTVAFGRSYMGETHRLRSEHGSEQMALSTVAFAGGYMRETHVLRSVHKSEAYGTQNGHIPSQQQGRNSRAEGALIGGKWHSARSHSLAAT
jgi:hypothetical protein